MALALASVTVASAAAAAGAAIGTMRAMEKMMEPEQCVAGGSAQTAQPTGWRGFSMEEARAHADAGQQKSMARSPKEVLADLQRGNARFWMGSAVRPEKSAFERRGLISKQFPSVAILSCADSRVPAEIVFDQGLGDMFVVRAAGNALDLATTASLQYAVNHLKVKVVIVMGHAGCGVVKAAGLPVETLEKEPQALCNCLKALKAGLDLERLAKMKDPRASDREAIIENVYAQVAGLEQDASIMDKVAKGELLVTGAFYEISSGIVDFFDEVSQDSRARPSEQPSQSKTHHVQQVLDLVFQMAGLTPSNKLGAFGVPLSWM